MAYTPIKCQLYDYIEIACLRHYTLKIDLLDGNQITAKAMTTSIHDKKEFLQLEIKEKNSESVATSEIRLDKIKQITALDDNSEFKTVTINTISR